MTVTVSPACVQPGTKLSFTAITRPKAGVVYQAIYSDKRSGATPPYGAGYGGNSYGQADSTGRFEDSFVVAANAPPGIARLDVITGAHQGQGYGNAHFTVAHIDGSC